MKTAITGGIGSGKSHVCQLLKQQGIEIYDCDSAAKRLMRTSDTLKEQQKRLVGDEVYIDASVMEWRECAILFESGFDHLVDRIICVSAPRELRIDRIMKRDGITREKADQWIECKMNQEEVAKRSHIIINNDGSPLSPQIAKIPLHTANNK